ncbi:hypothetical protein LT493_20745 [Streptomyces tricolor]|nr:hypothetical protein [Streptomyces tricolor]
MQGLRVALSGPAAVRHGVGSAEDGIFLFPVADGEFAMSVKHDVWDVPPEERPLPADVRARAAAFLDAVVGPGTWAVTRGRVFADTYTPDATPRLLPVSPADGVFAVTGLHGSGRSLAAGLAAHAARAVLAHRERRPGVTSAEPSRRRATDPARWQRRLLPAARRVRDHAGPRTSPTGCCRSFRWRA